MKYEYETEFQNKYEEEFHTGIGTRNNTDKIIMKAIKRLKTKRISVDYKIVFH